MDALLRRRALVGSGGEVPVPPGVEFYDYLVFDGNCGIGTTIKFPANCSLRVVLGNETSKVSQGVFYAREEGRIQLSYMGSTSATSRQIGVWYDSPSALTMTEFLPFTSATYGFFMTPSGYGWDSTWHAYSKGSQHPTNGVLNLAHATNNQRYTGVMGTFQIYGSVASGCRSFSAFNTYAPIITLRPCLYNGVAGFWYMEGGQFFGVSEGTGAVSVTNTL